MLNVLRRFVSLRGRPRKIRSDCGTNITKADKELKANVEEWNKSSIENFCMYTKGDWLGIILSCVWERIILSVRQILRASLTQLTVCAEVISTIIIVVEVLNTLHLTTFYIILRSCPSLPPGAVATSATYNQYLLETIDQGIPSLLAKVAEMEWTSEEPKDGRRGTFTDGNFPRGQWPLTRVVEAWKEDMGCFAATRQRLARQWLRLNRGSVGEK